MILWNFLVVIATALFRRAFLVELNWAHEIFFWNSFLILCPFLNISVTNWRLHRQTHQLMLKCLKTCKKKYSKCWPILWANIGISPNSIHIYVINISLYRIVFVLKKAVAKKIRIIQFQVKVATPECSSNCLKFGSFVDHSITLAHYITNIW